jgi:small subunit ribosomal protein S20
LIEDSETEAAEEAVTRAVVALDKAAQKGAIHQNNASRRKSRLMKQLDSTKDD